MPSNRPDCLDGGWEGSPKHMQRLLQRLIAATLFCTLLCGIESVVDAQQSPTRKPTSPRRRTNQPANSRNKRVQQAGAQKRLPRRKLKQPVLTEQKLSPELEQILKDWEKKTALIKKLSAHVKKIETDGTFGVQKLGEGEIKFEGPDKASYHLEPSAVPPEQDKIEPAAEERWYCTGKEVYQISDMEKTYRVVPIPKEMQGKRIIDGPLPFLFGMKAEEAKRRYRFFPLKPVKNIPNSVWLKVIPRLQKDRANYRVAKLILDKETYVPIAVMTEDPAGTTKTTYLLTNIKVNPQKWFPWQGNFIKPKLKGYKLVIDSAGEAPGRTKVGGLEEERGGARNTRGTDRGIRQSGFRSRSPSGRTIPSTRKRSQTTPSPAK